MKKYKIVKDPVHGYVRIYDHEKKIVDTFAFQRLRRIKQLALAHYVYPGAVHTRFEHSLGVAHVVEKFVRDVLSKLGISRDDMERYVAMMRLIALLHDVGHGPYSHVFEEYVLYPRKFTHEDMSARIVEKSEELSPWIERVANEYGYRLQDVSRALASRTVAEWPFTEDIAEGANERALFYLFKGPFCADIIDYLLRDSYYTGARYGISIDWERLSHFTYIEGDRLAVDARALEVLDQIIIARLFMFSTVYYHKKVRAISRFLGLILTKIDSGKLIDFDECLENVERYVELDDCSLIMHSEVRKLEEVRKLLSRSIPYRAVAEQRVAIHHVPVLDRLLRHRKNEIEEFIEKSVEERARELGIEVSRGTDFFVDTPILPLNPMLYDDTVLVRSEGGSVVQRRVLELTWFTIPSSAAVVRLYVNRERGVSSNILRDVFYEVLGRELRSFY